MKLYSLNLLQNHNPKLLIFTEALLGKEHKDQQVNYDVKIGDGMDIAIHGENGRWPALLSIC